MKKILVAGALAAALLAFPATALAYPGDLGCSGAGTYGACPQHTMGAHCAVAQPAAFAQPLMGGILRSTTHAHGHFHQCPALEGDSFAYRGENGGTGADATSPRGAYGDSACPYYDRDACPYPDGACNGAGPDCANHGSCYGANAQNTGRSGHHGSGHGHGCQR